MSRRVQRLGVSVPDDAQEVGQSELDDITLETTYDGQTFAWGPGQVRNFVDDGVGVGHQNADHIPQGGTATAGLASVFAGSDLFATDGIVNH